MNNDMYDECCRFIEYAEDVPADFMKNVVSMNIAPHNSSAIHLFPDGFFEMFDDWECKPWGEYDKLSNKINGYEVFCLVPVRESAEMQRRTRESNQADELELTDGK